MNVDAIKQILDLVREHELTEFELEQAGVKLRVRKQGAATAGARTGGAADGAAAGTAAGAHRGARAHRRSPRPPRPRSRRPWNCRS